MGFQIFVDICYHLNMQHRQWIAFSGFVWFLMGGFLLYKGLHWMSEAIFSPCSLSCRYQDFFGGPQQAANVLVVTALVVGYLKGRFVLSKTVTRIVRGIVCLQLPIRIGSVYPKSYWLLISAMMGLGLTLRFLPIPLDLRGFLDIAVGSALIQGSFLYFRAAREFTCDI